MGSTIKVGLPYHYRFYRRECFVGFQEDTPAAVVYLASKQSEEPVTGVNWENEVRVVVLTWEIHTDIAT